MVSFFSTRKQNPSFKLMIGLSMILKSMVTYIALCSNILFISFTFRSYNKI